METLQKLECAVVIRCFNEAEHIEKLLRGIFHQTLKKVEIILVDSGSTDETLTIASRYPVKIIHIHPEDFSFGRALNRGCEVASADFIVLASAHVYPVYDDWLETLLSHFMDDRVGLVYGKQRGNEQTKYSEYQIFRQWFPDKSNNHQSHPFCNNANAAIRKNLWEQIAYDENVTGLEDLDWAKRIMELRYKIAYSAEAEIIHLHNESYGSIFNRYRREAIALKQIIPEEKFTFPDFLRLCSINTLNDWRHAWHDQVCFQEYFSILAFRLMQFWGTYRGFSQKGPITTRLKQRFYYPHNTQHSRYNSSRSDSARRIDYSIHLKEER
ncbi:MAG: glycosyltransferase [Deltaproteobacteria bacterium]|nr:glycosyltransferase [Deltaproteobacteria bacterium]TLN04787.1 MAG: glycosyltransferase [bacterium]